MKKVFNMNMMFFTMQANSVIYSLKKIPLLNNILSDSISKNFKFLFGLLGFIKELVLGIISSSFSIIFFVTVCGNFIADLFAHKSLTNSAFAILFIVINCLCISLFQSTIFKINKEDNMFLNHFNMNPKEYYKYKINKDIFKKTIFIIPALIYIFNDFHSVIFLLSLKYLITILGHNFFLSAYSRKKKIPVVWKRLLMVT